MGRTAAATAVLASVIVAFLTASVNGACLEFPGYAALESSDHYGGDIGQAASPAAAEALCTTDSACKGFNSLGWYKRDIAPVTKLTGACFYIKVGQCPPLAGYFVMPNADHFGLGGDDIGKAASFPEAASACSSDSSCQGFNSAGYTKRRVAPVNTMAWSCLYVKECPLVVDYVAFPHTDRFFGDIGQAFSLPDALSKCSYDNACQGVNTLGWYKKTTTPVVSAKGICLYTKSAECPSVDGYVVKPGADHGGDDIGRAEGLLDAISKCNSDASCKGFNSAGWYKRLTSPSKSTAGSCLYSKASSPPSPKPPSLVKSPPFPKPPPTLKSPPSPRRSPPTPPPSPPSSSPLPSPVPPPPCPSPPAPQQCTLLWADEFDDNALDTSAWNYYTGTAYNNELEYYTDRKENVRLENGNLVVEARAESMGGKAYTSGRIDTRLKRAYYPGMTVGGRAHPKIRIEARIRLPQGQGMWPAFWLLPNSAQCDSCGPYGSWPYSGEIDILEAINEMSFAACTLHYMANGFHQQSQAVYRSDQLALQWHTYTLEWVADQMWWYIDGVQRGNLKSASLDPNGWSTTSATATPVAANSPFDAPFYVVLNLAVGGDWPGSPNAQTNFPDSMLVDYVRVNGCVA